MRGRPVPLDAPDVDSPALLAHLEARATLVRHCHRTSGLPRRDAARRDAGRVPATDSVSQLATPGLFLLHGHSLREGSTTSCCVKANACGYPAAGAARRQRPRPTGPAYVELGLCVVSPDERLLAYSVDRDRRRGLRAAVPRPRDGRGPGRRGAAHLLRRRLERGLGALLLHRPRRGLPAATRSGGTRSARRSPTTCWCSRSPTSASSCSCARPAAAAWS